MRIVVDLQGAQSTGSRSRGIGRYSLALAKAMAADAAAHDLWIALSSFYPNTIEPLRAEFDNLVPQRQVVVWQTPGPVAKLEPSSQWRMETGELVREAFLAGLKPDIVHVSSLFEGLTDDVLTSIGSFDSMLPTAVTLYDLIPLVHREAYLADAMVESWYERKLGHLRRAQLWLAISESSRREAIDQLGLPDEWVVNMSTAADSIFRPVEMTAGDQGATLHRYALTRPFLMYTGGIDKRKNIERLIGAYARLPAVVRLNHQLAIVCSATDDQIGRLERLARQRGLGRDELIVTGFVPDHDLVALYNLCKAFVFPSWHEGFGLPALEAMNCGAAVIGARTSSVPEVIGRIDALFDPHDESNITAKLNEVLTDEAFRQALRQHALPQAGRFSWNRTARSALDAMERLHRLDKAAGAVQLRTPPRRPRLAYVSPLPPERSGIADYSAELLPELARHYDIDAIVKQGETQDPWIRANVPVRDADWFDQNAGSYDRVVYHFGNSAFHAHMFILLERHPGVVVLHDFFLSGVLAHMEWTRSVPDAWSRALFDSHGYRAVSDRFVAQDPTDVVFKYPANLLVLQQADGIIVHSKYSRALGDSWYGTGFGAEWIVIPHLRTLRTAASRMEAKVSLGFRSDDFLICSFGMMGPTKLNHRLLAAWLASPLSLDERCHLVFVGEKDTGPYGREFAEAVARSAYPARIHVTGFALPDQYRSYLAATDVAVQLRARSRGETSGTVLDCMGRGLPTVVNVIGAAAELLADCVAALPAEFTDEELQELLSQLERDRSAACRLGERAAERVRAHNAPRTIADRYREAIERFARTGLRSRGVRLARRIATVGAVTPPTERDWLNLATCIAQNNGLDGARPRQWLLDTTELTDAEIESETSPAVRAFVLDLLNDPPVGIRVEPVHCGHSGTYRYARRYGASLMMIHGLALPDEVVEPRAGDSFFRLGKCLHPLAAAQVPFFEDMRQRGVHMYGVHYGLPNQQPTVGERNLHGSVTFANFADGIVAAIDETINQLITQLSDLRPERQRPIHIAFLQSGLPSRHIRSDPDADNSFTRASGPARVNTTERHDTACKCWTRQMSKQVVEIIVEGRWQTLWHPDR